MKISKQKFDVARARACMTWLQLTGVSGVSSATLSKAVKGESVSAVTVGKLANALRVPVEDLLAADPEEQTQARGD
jgi:transcriptional regulator with XRE-family HTH domain